MRIEFAMIDEVLNNQNNKLKGLVASLIVLNALDGILTITWVGAGMATEANPFMEPLIGMHPVLFMLVKILLVSLGAMLLWRYRHKTIAVASLYFCFTLYSLVILYHGMAWII